MAAGSIFYLTSLPDPPVLILLGVFLLTALRQVGSLRLQIWQVMTIGALLVLLLGEISPEEAFRAVNIRCDYLPLRSLLCRRSTEQEWISGLVGGQSGFKGKEYR